MKETGKAQRRRKEEDAIFNKMLLWLAGAMVAELVVFLLKRIYVDFWLDVEAAYGLSIFFRAFRFAGAALTAAAAAWLTVCLRKGKKSVLPMVCTAALAFLWIIAVLAYQFYDTGMRVLMALPVAAAVLILIYFLYQRTFFVTAALTGGGIAALWLYRGYYANHPTRVLVCFVIGWVLLAAAAALAWKLSKTGGKLGSLRLMPDGTIYNAVYFTCALTALSMALALPLGEAAAFYLMFVLLGWLFGQAVFFTVKLM